MMVTRPPAPPPPPSHPPWLPEPSTTYKPGASMSNGLIGTIIGVLVIIVLVIVVLQLT
jgi:hypothetical protein